MKENLLIDKSIAFASRIIKLHQYLIKTKKETIISKQIVRSGTSIGANINEKRFSNNGRTANLIINYSSAKRLHSSLFIQNPLEINE